MKKIFFCCVLMGVGLVGAAPPSIVNYQGVLKDAAGVPLDGGFDMTFRFFGVSAGGLEILADAHLAVGTGNVTVTGGLFNAGLGNGTVTDGPGAGTYTTLGDVFRDFGDVWLELEIGGEILAPRTPLRSAPFALNSENLDGLGAGQLLRADTSDTFATGGTLTVDSGATLDVKGDLRIQAGAPGAGKVLTSGAANIGTWQDLPSVQLELLQDLSDRLGSENPSDLPFATPRPFDCLGGDTATLEATVAGAPLGVGVDITGFVGEEALGGTVRYLVALESTTAQTFNVGDEFELELNLSTEPAPIKFIPGEITASGLGGFANGRYTYVVEIEPRLFRMGRSTGYATFQQLGVKNVIESVMANYGILTTVESSPEIIDHFLQYEETDLDFLRRIGEKDGYHFRFLDNKQVVWSTTANVTTTTDVFAYHGASQDPGDGSQFLATLHPRDRLFTRTTKAMGWDPLSKSLVVDSVTAPESGPLVATFQEFFADSRTGASVASRAQTENSRERARAFELTGTGTAASLRAGFTFDVADISVADTLDGQYYVTSIVHYAIGDPAASCVSYGNAFTALPKNTLAHPSPGIPFVPPRRTPKPVFYGPVTAIVTNTVDPSQLGRVKVGLLTDPPGLGLVETDWVRVVFTAGERFDMAHIPQVEDEVIVSFMNGDPDRPLVIGGVYSGVDVPETRHRLMFPPGDLLLGTAAPERAWIEWVDSLNRFEVDGDPLQPTPPTLFVKGDLQLNSGLTLLDAPNPSRQLLLSANQFEMTANLKIPNALSFAATPVDETLSWNATNFVLSDDLDLSGDLIVLGTAIKGATNLNVEASADLDLRAGANLNLAAPAVASINAALLNITSPTTTFNGNVQAIGAATFTGGATFSGATQTFGTSLITGAVQTGALTTLGNITANGDVIVNGNNLDFGLGGALRNTGTFFSVRTAGDTNTDDLFLEGGNSADDGEIAIFGDGAMRFRAGNGWFNYFEATGGMKTAELQEDGDFRIRGVFSESVAFDIAESFMASERLEPGELVALDTTSSGSVRRTHGAGDPLVLGVVSTRPGLLLGGAPFDVEGLREVWGDEVAEQYLTRRPALRDSILGERVELRVEGERLGLWPAAGERESRVSARVSETPDDRDVQLLLDQLESECLERFHAERFVPVALAGRVPVKVDASAAAIVPGDALTPGPIPGVAVKATGPGPIVGTALEGLASGQGLIVAFVQRSYLGATLAPTARVGAPSDSEHADAQTPGLVENPADATTVSRLTAPLTMTASDNLASSRDILHVDAEGNIFTRGAFHPAAMDLAEFFSVSESAEAGDVLAIDPQNPGQFRRARQAHDTSVVGIVSETPGVLLGSGIDRIVAADATLAAGLEQARLLGDDLREEELWQELKTRFRETHAPVALSGTVPCKVDAGFGAIRPGDLLTTSPTPGHAMRAGDAVAGTIIGKALEPLEDGTGTIRVLVMMR